MLTMFASFFVKHPGSKVRGIYVISRHQKPFRKDRWGFKFQKPTSSSNGRPEFEGSTKNSTIPRRKSTKSGEGMRSVLVQSKSKSSTGNSSSTTTTTMEDDRSEERDSSCYYPGCRKDANCNCEICLASINATLDLMPMSIHKSSLTKLSVSRPTLESTPISLDASILSTPTSGACKTPSNTIIKSNATLNLNQNVANEKKRRTLGLSGSGINFLRLLLVLCFLLSADVVLPWAVSGILQTALSPDVVKRVGEKCWSVRDLNGKLRFLQEELRSVVDGKVSNCSYTDSAWKINQDGLLLNSRCTLYKSAIEEVTIWGWPLQTAGLLTAEFSFRTFTVLSGRVTEWHGGQVGYLIRKTNNSWVQPKWGASVVQLDPNTWVLEYQRSPIFDGTGLYSAALEFLKYRIAGIIGRAKKDFWLFAAIEDNQYSGFTTNNGIKIPT